VIPSLDAASARLPRLDDGAPRSCDALHESERDLAAAFPGSDVQVGLSSGHKLCDVLRAGCQLQTCRTAESISYRLGSPPHRRGSSSCQLTQQPTQTVSAPPRNAALGRRDRLLFRQNRRSTVHSPHRSRLWQELVCAGENQSRDVPWPRLSQRRGAACGRQGL
jgi:hypothetical protein